MSEHVMGVMRYFIEVTEDEANAFEAEGRGIVLQGASGGADRPNWFGTSCSWLLLGSHDLIANERNAS